MDDDGRRYIVANLEIKTTKGKGASGRSFKSSQASVGILASWFGLDKIGFGVKGKKVERLEFEITNPVREESTDMAIDEVLDPFLEQLDNRADNRIFLFVKREWLRR